MIVLPNEHAFLWRLPIEAAPRPRICQLDQILENASETVGPFGRAIPQQTDAFGDLPFE